MNKLYYLLALVFAIGMIFGPVFAYELPSDHSQTQFFCIFGLQGSRFDGNDKMDPDQVIYFDVPESQSSGLIIDIFDPDTGGKLDQKDPGNEDWETIFQFAVYGKEETLLDKKKFGESADYDMDYFRFGPYPREMGKKIKGFYRFELVVSPVRTLILKGDDLNLFKVRVYPEDVVAFSEKISLRLAAHKNDQMHFYPQLPANESMISVENYDLDPEGGEVSLYDPLTQKNYPVNNSGSGVWAQTKIELAASKEARRLEYTITKKTQRYGNASIRVKDRNGRALPIYYSQLPDKAVLDTAAAGIPVKAKEVKAGAEEIDPAVKSLKSIARQKQVQADLPRTADVIKQKSPVITQPVKNKGSQCNKFTFDGTASYDPDNEKLSFLWDFGDSTTSVEPVVTHVFEKGGLYKVTLTVKDSSGLNCDSASITQVVNANIPPVPGFTAPETACVNQEIFFDASSTVDDTPENLTYTWDFSDKTTADGKQITKKFAKGGVYKVNLTVDDNANTSCSKVSLSKLINVNTPPKAALERIPPVCLGNNAMFDASRTSGTEVDNYKYTWDFGDGVIIEGNKKEVHAYKKGGKFTVKVTVDDKRNTPCSVDSASIEVAVNTPPVAAGQADFACCIDTETIFDGTASSDADNDILTYQWEFGDGGIAQGAKTTHRYNKGGVYTVTLKVDDNSRTACSGSQTQFKIRINDAPVPVIKVK